VGGEKERAHEIDEAQTGIIHRMRMDYAAWTYDIGLRK